MDAFNENEQIGVLLESIYGKVNGKYTLTSVCDYESIEYFVASILNAMYGYSLINLNEKHGNSPYIDLIDYGNNIGVQVTIESPNSEKLRKSINSFDKYKIGKLIVFFFSMSKLNKIQPVQNEEIWSLHTIQIKLKENPSKSRDVISILKKWNGSYLPSGLSTKISGITISQINSLKKIKKIDDSLFVCDDNEQRKSLYFCGPDFGEFTFLSLRDLFYKSSYGQFLKKLDNDDKYSFKNLEMIDDFWEISYDYLEERQKNLLDLYRNSEENAKKKDYYQYSNRSTYSIFNEIISSNHAYNSNIMALIRSAGQGKTVFCCELANYLIKNGVICFFITRVLHSGSLYDEFMNQISRIDLNNNYNDNLCILSSYVRIFNRVVIIIIDALNEYSNIKESINYIDSILKDCRSAGFEPRIVISSRNKKYDDFKNNLNSISNNVYPIISSRLNNRDIKVKYFSKFDIQIKYNPFLERMFEQSRLFIKIFCETFEGTKGKIDDIDILTLFQKYFSKRAQMDLEDNLFEDTVEFFETIDYVTSYIAEKSNVSEIPLKVFDKEQRKNISKMADGDIFIINSNEKKEETVSFVFEEFRDYFLLEYCKEKDAESIEKFIKEKDFNIDGLIRNIILFRRKDDRFNKKEDIKYEWYANGSIDVVLNLPLSSLDEIDKQIMLEKIDNTYIDGEISASVIIKLISIFVDPQNQNTPFNLKSLSSFSHNGKVNLSRFLSSDSICNWLFGLIKNNFSKNYLIELFELMSNVQVRISQSNRDNMIHILRAQYNISNSKSLDELSSYGYSSTDLNILNLSLKWR